MGKYRTTFADERTWRSVRVAECKGSGVAAACATWRRCCEKNPDQIVRDARTQDEAGKAVHAMSAALDTARKKLEPARAKLKLTPVMRSPYNDTRELLQDWETELDLYHQRLMQAGTKYHGAAIRREQFLKKLTLEDVVSDSKLWAEFLRHAASQQAREVAESYWFCRQRRYQQMVAKYGKNNDYNLDPAVNADLVNHFINGQPLPPGRLTHIVENAESHFSVELEGPGSCLDRFKQTPAMQDYLGRRFPCN